MMRSRLEELLSRKLGLPHDRAELEELAELLRRYRRQVTRDGSGEVDWQRCEVAGRTAWRIELSCGHYETVIQEHVPRAGLLRNGRGIPVAAVPLSFVCYECARQRGEA